jgi:hypothetical protein
MLQQRSFIRGAAGEPPGPGQNSGGLALYRYQTNCGTVLGHTGNFPGLHRVHRRDSEWPPLSRRVRQRGAGEGRQAADLQADAPHLPPRRLRGASALSLRRRGAGPGRNSAWSPPCSRKANSRRAVPRRRVATDRRADATPAQRHEVSVRGPALHRSRDRRRALAGALRWAAERALRRARATRAIGVDSPAHACSPSPQFARRHSVGPARPQPGRHGRPASSGADAGGSLDGDRAWPLPRPRRRRPPVRALAPRSHDRDAPRRACGRAAARPHPRRGELWAAEVDPLPTDDRPRCRNSGRASRAPRDPATRAPACRRGLRRRRPRFRRRARRHDSPAAAHRLVSRASQGGGYPTGSLHVLRHRAATLALTSGIPVHIVAARLGDDPKMVLSTYAHLLPSSDEAAAERVAAALTR